MIKFLYLHEEGKEDKSKSMMSVVDNSKLIKGVKNSTEMVIYSDEEEIGRLPIYNRPNGYCIKDLISYAGLEPTDMAMIISDDITIDDEYLENIVTMELNPALFYLPKKYKLVNSLESINVDTSKPIEELFDGKVTLLGMLMSGTRLHSLRNTIIPSSKLYELYSNCLVTNTKEFSSKVVQVKGSIEYNDDVSSCDKVEMSGVMRILIKKCGRMGVNIVKRYKRFFE